MLQTVIPQGYAPCLNLYDTQKAIGLLKRLFEDTLGGALHLRRVSAPLFVEASTGLNDDLNGVERAVSFDIPDAGRDAQVVHSLAKWKRMALYRYQFSVGEGLYTDMNAIRRDEELANLHSVDVDQWDWEKIIAPRDRNADYLRQTVRTIVSAMAETQHTLRSVFPQLTALPPLGTEVSFVTTQELEELWPDRSPKEREDAWVTEHRRVRGPAGASLPQAAAGGQAAPHHRRRHRPVPPVHAPAGQGPHRRGTGQCLG